MKKAKRVILIIIIPLVSVILIEYLYSQRWRLQGSEEIDNYGEIIIGKWGTELLSNSNNIYLYKFQIEEDGSYRDISKQFPTLSLRNGGKISGYKSWSLDNSNLTITTDFSAVGLTSKETISVQKEIVFANNNFLVFKEKSNSIFSRIIPRKQIYIRVN
ncbi:hypothetical protein CL684_02330 [Candidatus Campbellbacteria bacterium]|nr:hypothetical protein [Candidatus Campbellbacteria bacterium]|tara:strand:+ start:233 stop:709 length:477 start_codon:yes stop_codon:yes gene_type:complete